ncbi:hypothetical protein GCM10023149_39590 [Mucilaginibacter gynuensis]|uniref:Uncharacterized protein n=1 Tax=Mucilaginibacter gynuensis TaxID=1302236 RepID=A0ABP8H2B2_9SPHI
MINPVTFTVISPDGSERKLIIEPVIERSAGEQVHATGVYKLYKSAFDDKTILFTEPLEIGKENNDLADASNPDYLGKITTESNAKWHYEGDLLSHEEQQQVVDYIANV